MGVASLAFGGATVPAQEVEEQQNPEFVAVWRDGGATIAELESGVSATQTPACQGSNLGAWGENPEGVTDCLEDVARRIALEEMILREIPDLRKAVDGLGNPPGALFRRAYANTWRRWFAEAAAGQASEREILVYYETHRDRFRQRGSVELWNIFLRDDPGTRSGQTEVELLELKTRIESGEPFERLAREYSQSETRTRGGFVGSVTRGQLSADLEAVVFGLEAGETSDPVRVAGGALLLQVRKLTPGSDLPLDMVRERVAGQLVAERRAAAVAEIVKDVNLPKGSVVLSKTSLMAALDGTDLDAPVLSVYDTRMTARQFRERERLDTGIRIAELGEARRETLWLNYVTIKNGALLGAALVVAAEPELRAAADVAALNQGARTIVAETLRREAETVPVEETSLRRHFDENRDRYRVPLQLKLRICEAPFGDDPMRQLAELDGVHGKLESGLVELGEICAGSGGRVAELDWVTPEELRHRLPSKSLALVRQLEVGDFTVPYQQSGSIVIVELVDRKKPREMSFEEARGRVAREVAAMQGRQALRRAADARLEKAGFRFDETRVRAILASGSPRPASG